MRRPSGALSVGGGILASRLFGLLRERAVAHYFGVSALADVFSTAFRGPTILQNLLGEQALSSSFIPILSRFLDEQEEEAAGRFAGAIFGLLLSATALLAVAGVLLARPLVALLVPGYLGDAEAVRSGAMAVDRFELAVVGVRLLFPMAGLAVLAAWCLGVLNSHRRFFLPYFAPVLWNASIIAALLGVGGVSRSPDLGGERLFVAGCVGALIGGLLQFLVQLPVAWRLLGGLRLSLSTRVEGVREALRNFGPAVAGRGVVQLSSYVDQVLGSFLAVGALGALRYGQQLYALPVGLFGLAIAAAELPELSRIRGRSAESSARLVAAWRQMMFLTLPTVVGYFLFGYLIVGALYRTGNFTTGHVWLVYLILGAYSSGLIATSTSRLLQNAFFALGDTRSPARVAVLRLLVSAGAGVVLMTWLDRFVLSDFLRVAEGGSELHLGGVGLAAASGLAAWIERGRLASLLRSRSELDLPWSLLWRLLGLALVAALPAGGAWWLLREWHPLAGAVSVIGVYAALYLVLCRLAGVPEAMRLADFVIGRFFKK